MTSWYEIEFCSAGHRLLVGAAHTGPLILTIDIAFHVSLWNTIF